MFKFNKRTSILDRDYYFGEISIEQVHRLLPNVGDFLVYFDPDFVVSQKSKGAYFLVVKYEGDANDDSPYFTVRFTNLKSLDFIPRIIDKFYPSGKLLNKDPKVVLLNPVLKQSETSSKDIPSEKVDSDESNKTSKCQTSSFCGNEILEAINEEEEVLNTSLNSIPGPNCDCEENTVFELAGVTKHWPFHLFSNRSSFPATSGKNNTLTKNKNNENASISVPPPNDPLNNLSNDETLNYENFSSHLQKNINNAYPSLNTASKEDFKKALAPLIGNPPKNTSKFLNKSTQNNSSTPEPDNLKKSLAEKRVSDTHEHIILGYAIAKAKSFPDFVYILHSELKTPDSLNPSAKIIQAAEMLFENSKKMVNFQFESLDHFQND